MSAAPRRILVVGPAWVGDMVMAQSLFGVLARRHPEAAIDVLAETAALPVADFIPEVRRSIPLPFAHGELALWPRRRLAKRLAAERYDLALITPRALKKAIIPYWAGIPRRVGLGTAPFGILTERRPPEGPEAVHQSDRFVRLALDAGEPLPDYPPPRLVAEPAAVERALERAGQTRAGAKLLILVPGSGGLATKRWPAESYAEVARRRLAAGWRVWLTGGPDERDLTGTIAAAAPGAVDLAGRVGLGEAIALLSLADQVLANDSGAMHVAAAFERPTIGLFGPTDPAFTAPRNAAATALSRRLACSPCKTSPCPLGHFDCLAGLDPGAVLAAMDRQLAAAGVATSDSHQDRMP